MRELSKEEITKMGGGGIAWQRMRSSAYIEDCRYARRPGKSPGYNGGSGRSLLNGAGPGFGGYGGNVTGAGGINGRAC
ncbi:hypothetical protein JCM19000A_00740 [Silvimonas sp. JCM 19000]